MHIPPKLIHQIEAVADSDVLAGRLFAGEVAVDLGRAFQGYKRFSIEGTDMMVPMLDTAIDCVATTASSQPPLMPRSRGGLSCLTVSIAKIA